MIRRLTKTQEYFIPVLLTLATLSIAPWFSIEPINSIKFLFLVAAAFLSIGYLSTNFLVIKTHNFKGKIFLSLMFLFVISNLIIFMKSDINWRQQLFGYLGRNTGLVFQLSIAMVTIFLFCFSNFKLEANVIKALNICGILSLFYGALQYFHMDPINWNNPYGPIIGFLGNPNFQSSFLGLYSILLFHWFIESSVFTRKWILSLLTFVSNIFIVIVSDSIQGIFVLGIGASIIILWKLRTLKLIRTSRIYSLTLLLGLILSVFGLLQKGPLKFLYQPSVSFRGDYWRAGWKMFQDHLIFGLGHSSFGDYYMSYRDKISLSGIEGRGPDTFSNSPHNVIIDLATSGGLFLLIPYVSIIMVSFYCLFLIRNTDQKRSSNSILFAALWFGYLLQATISVQFITLSFWGWVFVALFLRNSINPDYKQFSDISIKLDNSPVLSNNSLKTHAPLVAIIGAVGILIGLMPLKAGMAQKSAYESRRLDLIISSAYAEPLDADRMNQIALLIAKNGQIPQALDILKMASKITPRNHDTWNLISKLAAPNSPEAKKARYNFEKLNPYFDYNNKTTL